MTATTLPPTVGLSFGRLVRSEWIKFRSIRSTIWCLAILVVLTIAMAVLIGNALDSGQPVTQDQANGTLVTINTASVSLTALVVAVLGVLIITGEYGTGQVRSTFTADPGRTGVILAKAAVLAVTTFVVSAVSIWIGVIASAALQAGKGVHADLADPSVFMPLLGASVYVALLALLAYGIGLLVRSSAGGIAITLGILLVLPGVLSLVASAIEAQWLADVVTFLPAQAGGQLFAFSSGDAGQQAGIVLNGWGGFAVLLAEVVVVGALALTVARRRDV
ncbi:ABC transporter permease subunit [Curtobacterium pusillum]|uniref:ABC transporter permease subunit n=1 Tax=Curtobacterium pusillum TaxID=69373 RepID=A0AAW3T925_9MICO|nr:ABC transporter permease [Curtobacterium pusillum]MBA8991588.1 ABC-2 type transport system permease protein [Curtobacterium pusillum]NUU14253.1 ABC transporter permease subunit [Curtobacterium pusillum]GLK30638.1 ABC transporter permease [Curtobacterium pusillum]